MTTDRKEPATHRQVIGFTGTRHGVSADQWARLLAYLLETKPDTVLHGGCRGADAACHNMVVSTIETVSKITVYPGMDRFGKSPHAAVDLLGPDYAVGRRLQITTAPPQHYSVRNAQIVQECDLLVACPDSHTPKLRRSGTWQTIRMARRRPCVIIFPNGEVEHQ